MCLVNKKKLAETKEIMHKGDLYLPNDTNLLIHQTFRLDKLRRRHKVEVKKSFQWVSLSVTIIHRNIIA